MSIRQLVGDARVRLAELAPSSVQCVITSPPYFGLRDYGTEPLVWGGDDGHEHEWDAAVRSPWANGVPGPSDNHPKNGAASHWTPKIAGQFCPCGAWLGSLGLEPTPEAYLEHLVEVFRAVRRVLRPDGCMFVNLGDSYAGSGKGPSNSVQSDASQIGPSAVKKRNPAQFANGQAPTQWISTPAGLKSKDLMMMPARLAMALQADGWWLRSMIPWVKRNSMPESCRDRPSTSLEYVFLLSKGSRYFWDADTVRVTGNHVGRLVKATGPAARNGNAADLVNDRRTAAGFTNHDTLVGPRNRRNSDWFLESWQGLMLDEADAPLALIVNPQPFKESHFATFPPKLVEPVIKAGTSEKGECSECGAPWMRVSTTRYENPGNRTTNGPRSLANREITAGFAQRLEKRTETQGWRPSCQHNAAPVSQTVLDPFAGAGTVGLVADRLGRDAVLIDLKTSYADMAAARLIGDAPMFVNLERGV